MLMLGPCRSKWKEMRFAAMLSDHDVPEYALGSLMSFCEYAK